MAKPLFAIAFLTWKASMRYRFFWVMLFLLALSVGGLPMVIKDDGSAEGMTQILITYTLSMITAIMGAATLWISAGSLANEIENHQLQMVVTKPVSKWQIWLGKWMGVMSINFVLLLLTGGIVLGMVEYRTNKLTRDALEKIEPRPDLDIAMATFRLGNSVFVQDPQNPTTPLSSPEPQPLLAELAEVMGDQFRNSIAQFQAQNNGKEPLLHPVEKMRKDIASLEEKKLRRTLLLARAPFSAKTQVERLVLIPPATNAPPNTPPNVTRTPRDLWVKGLIDEYWPVREAQLLRQNQEREESQGVDLADRSWELSDKKIALERKKMEDEVIGYSQTLEPFQGLALNFKKPMHWKPESSDNFILRIYFEDTQVGYKDDELYPIFVRAGPRDSQFRVGSGFQLDARAVHEIQMPVSLGSSEDGKSSISMFGEDDDNVTVEIFNSSRKKLKIPYLDSRNRVGGQGVEIIYDEAGFYVNYVRGLGIIFAWLGVLTALGLFAGSFMSFGMSAFACLGILTVIVFLGMAEEVVEEGTVMQTYTEGKRDQSIMDKALPALGVIVKLVKPIKDYSPIEKLTEGRSITWGELLRAYGYIWGLSALTLGFLGSYILSRRQIALTSESGGGGSVIGTEFLVMIIAVFAGLLIGGYIVAIAIGIIGAALILRYKIAG